MPKRPQKTNLAEFREKYFPTETLCANSASKSKKRPSDEARCANPVKRQRESRDQKILNSPTDSTKCEMYQNALAKVLRERALGDQKKIEKKM